MKTYPIDSGVDFGLWKDPTSRLMYFDVMDGILDGLDTAGNVADYGGANGLLKHFIPNAVSIDCDPTKQPDIVDDILTHEGEYDLIVIRYVLHYLDPLEQFALFRHISTFHDGPVLVIQFTNDGEDYDLKMENSINELKYFLTGQELRDLFQDFDILWHKQHPYQVTAEFYANRLDNPNGKPHGEVCNAVLIRREQ